MPVLRALSTTALQCLDAASKVAHLAPELGEVVAGNGRGSLPSQYTCKMVGRPAEGGRESGKCPWLPSTGVQHVHQLANGRQRDARARREVGHRRAPFVETIPQRSGDRLPLLTHVSSRSPGHVLRA
jgi:hypothetical protein